MPVPRAELLLRQTILLGGLAVIVFLFWNFSEEDECRKRIVIAALLCSLFAIWKVYRRSKSVYLMLIFVLEAAMLFSNSEAMKAKKCHETITIETDPLYFIFYWLTFIIMWFDITIVMFFNLTILIYVVVSIIATFSSNNPRLMGQFHQFADLDPGLKFEERNRLSLSYYTPKKDETGLNDVVEHCSICLNVFSLHDQIITLPKCKHVFHQGCLEQWFDSNITCPYCRENVREALHLALPVVSEASINY